MEPERWRRLKDLFDAALKREPESRSAFLRQACGGDEGLRAELEFLLAAEGNTHKMQSAVSPVAPLTKTVPPDAIVGSRIGAYQIVATIASGGMASVYLAVRADDQFLKRVAIKLIRPGLDSEDLLRRFRNERQTLAALDHPNIVKLLDGGSTADGVPYIVMDYVEGTPIDEFCDNHKLSVTDRLHLFRKVCAAVQYAHQNLVIHRDLKPSNILVATDGTPKLLDFGIAKLLNPQFASEMLLTRTQTRHLTPAYASPEQVRGEPVSASTDIYSLGVVLYELLTGHRPHRLKRYTLQELEQAICEQDPDKPSTVVNRIEEIVFEDCTSTRITPESVSRTRGGDLWKLRSRMRGDLDTIMLKALRKEPQRRYATVYEFSEDIRRHLEQLPIKARRGTLLYRGTKFLRRHKEGVLAALIMLLLIGATMTWEIRHRHRLETESTVPPAANPKVKPRRSVAVLGFKNLSGRPEVAWLSTALSEMLTTELGAGEKLRTISGENIARTRIDLSLPEGEELAPKTLMQVREHLEADLVVQGSYVDLGKDSGGQIRLDLRLQDAVVGETIAETAEVGTEGDLFELVTKTGAELRQKLGIGEVMPQQAAAVRATLPADSEAARMYSEGLRKLRVFDALAARRLLEEASSREPKFALVHSALAAAWLGLGYSEQARLEAKKALDLSANLSQQDQLSVEGQYRETIEDWSKAADLYRTLFALFPDNLDYGIRLARAQRGHGKVQDALATVAVLRKLPAPAGNDLRIELEEGRSAHSLSNYKLEQEAAERALRRGRADGERLLVAAALGMKGAALQGQDQFAEAMAALEESRQILLAAGDRGGAAWALLRKGEILQHQGDLSQSLESEEKSLAIFRSIGNKRGEAFASVDMANVFNQQGNPTKAKKLCERALRIFRQTGNKSLEALTINNIGVLFLAPDNPLSAEKAYRDALTIAKEVGNRYVMALALSNLGDILLRRGDLVGAKQAYKESLSISQETGDKDLSAAVIRGLGDALTDEGDFQGARTLYQRALASQQQMGERNATAQTQVSLATLAVEEGSFAESETAARTALEELGKEKDRAGELLAYAVLARALLAQGKSLDAQRVLDSSKPLLTTTHSQDVLLPFALVSAQVMAALGRPAQAISNLSRIARQAHRHALVRCEFQARLAVAETQIKSGQIAIGHDQLQKLAKDAAAQGFLLVVRKATAAMDGSRSKLGSCPESVIGVEGF